MKFNKKHLNKSKLVNYFSTDLTLTLCAKCQNIFI